MTHLLPERSRRRGKITAQDDRLDVRSSLACELNELRETSSARLLVEDQERIITIADARERHQAVEFVITVRAAPDHPKGQVDLGGRRLR